MAKDSDTGVDPVAADGEPSENELERRRQARGGSAKDRAAAAEEEQARLDADDGKGAGGAAAGDTDEEADGQFSFVVPESGKRITLGTMIPRGVPVTYRYKMTSKSVPNVKGGLIDPSDPNGLLLVSYVVEDVQVKFTRDSDRKIEKATVYVIMAPRDVVPAQSEAGQVMLRGGDEQAA